MIIHNRDKDTRSCVYCKKMKPYDDFDYESDDNNHVNDNCKGCNDMEIDKAIEVVEPVKKVDYSERRCPKCDTRGNCDCYTVEPDRRSAW